MIRKGENQSTLKARNRQLILNCLKEHARSCSDLARVTELSYTGVVTLVDEMVEERILAKEDAEAVSLGRRPILVRMTPRQHIVCVVNLVIVNSVYFYDLAGAQLHSYNFTFPTVITMENFHTIITHIKRTMADEFFGSHLETICIAAPGKIDKNTANFVFAPFIENYKSVNLVELFNAEFHVRVEIKNDLRFQLIAEKFYGKHRDEICDTLFVQLGGQGLGCALYLNNKLYEGANGLNGEIGLFLVDYGKRAYERVNGECYFQQKVSNTAFITAAALAISQGESSCLGALREITPLDMAKGYLTDDPLCCDIINYSARLAADVIKSLSEVLDFSNVIVSRETMIYGQKYVDNLSRYLNYQLESYNIDVYMSTFDREGILLGAKNYAIECAIKGISEK